MTKPRNTKRWGNSDIIMLKPSDKLDMNIDIGKDKIDIEDAIVIKPKKEKTK